MTADEARCIADAKWTILFEGFLLPVTNLFDTDGNQIDNPMHAATVVAYDDNRQRDKWLTIRDLEPGDLWSRHA